MKATIAVLTHSKESYDKFIEERTERKDFRNFIWVHDFKSVVCRSYTGCEVLKDWREIKDLNKVVSYICRSIKIGNGRKIDYN